MPSESRLIRFYAAAREAAGVPELEIPASDTGTVNQLHRSLVAACGPDITRVLNVSAILVAGQQFSLGLTPDQELPNDEPIDVLPPFAGG